MLNRPKTTRRCPTRANSVEHTEVGDAQKRPDVGQPLAWCVSGLTYLLAFFFFLLSRGLCSNADGHMPTSSSFSYSLAPLTFQSI